MVRPLPWAHETARLFSPQPCFKVGFPKAEVSRLFIGWLVPPPGAQGDCLPAPSARHPLLLPGAQTSPAASQPSLPLLLPRGGAMGAVAWQAEQVTSPSALSVHRLYSRRLPTSSGIHAGERLDWAGRASQQPPGLRGWFRAGPGMTFSRWSTCFSSTFSGFLRSTVDGGIVACRLARCGIESLSWVDAEPSDPLGLLLPRSGSLGGWR